MSEPKPIGEFKLKSKVGIFEGLYKLVGNNPLERDAGYLYEDGMMRIIRSPDFIVNVTKANKIFNKGPAHPDDWYWNEDEQRLKEMATLTEEEYLTVSMSNPIRITISEWDEAAYLKARAEQDLEQDARAWEIERRNRGI